jgi:glycosyltransferase involved in cell wall biosynthesis
MEINILQVSMLGNVGGAAKVAWDLAQAYRERGHRSMLAIGYPAIDEKSEDVFEIPNDRLRPAWSRLLYIIPRYMRRHSIRGSLIVRNALMPLAQPHRAIERLRGMEDYDFPATNSLLSLMSVRPDIIHCHNLHSDYFDLRALPKLSYEVPLVLTLHDMWLLTGHCAYSISCERWEQGCGMCPDLKRPPAIIQDSTAQNWNRKQTILSRSRLHVVTPSYWLADQVHASNWKPTSYCVIPNGVDLTIFHPIDKWKARHLLGLPENAFVLLFAAMGSPRNPYKDYQTIQNAVQFIMARCNGDPVVFVNLGGKIDRIITQGNCQIRFYKHRKQPKDVAVFYQAADVFLHASKADTYPSVILESMACGTPVIATAVGGIPEQVDDGVTGLLVPRSDATGMAQCGIQLMEDSVLRQTFAQNAVRVARQRFDFKRQVTEYLDHYQSLIDQEKSHVAE